MLKKYIYKRFSSGKRRVSGIGKCLTKGLTKVGQPNFKVRQLNMLLFFFFFFLTSATFTAHMLHIGQNQLCLCFLSLVHFNIQDKKVLHTRGMQFSLQRKKKIHGNTIEQLFKLFPGIPSDIPMHYISHAFSIRSDTMSNNGYIN